MSIYQIRELFEKKVRPTRNKNLPKALLFKEINIQKKLFMHIILIMINLLIHFRKIAVKQKHIKMFGMPGTNLISRLGKIIAMRVL